MALSREDKADVKRSMGGAMANKIAKVTNDAKSKALKKKASYDRSFGLPAGERVTPRLQERFKNYEKHLKRTGGWGQGTHERKLHKQNQFYHFNKPEYDSPEYRTKK